MSSYSMDGKVLRPGGTYMINHTLLHISSPLRPLLGSPYLPQSLLFPAPYTYPRPSHSCSSPPLPIPSSSISASSNTPQPSLSHLVSHPKPVYTAPLSHFQSASHSFLL